MLIPIKGALAHIYKTRSFKGHGHIRHRLSYLYNKYGLTKIGDTYYIEDENDPIGILQTD